ncbi:hypothetical protein [Shewanella xiamenensis]|uniref:hypothetical protein n=1 Tax=Shewanella xiamenensis TaxID=332186 RepID=UPI00313ED812
MNQISNPPQNNDTEKKNVGYNDALSDKGRASVVASSILILSSMSFIKLSQLPFIGTALEATEGAPLRVLLFISALYFWYRFCTYKRVVDLDSKSNDLSIEYAKKYLIWKSKRYISDAKRYVLSYGNLKGFGEENLSPAEHAMVCGQQEFWSNFHLRSWNAKKFGFHEFRWLDDENMFVFNECSHGKVDLKFESSYVLMQENPKTKKLILSSNIMTHKLCLSISHYRKLEIICKYIAKLRLPDFLEKVFPTVLFILAVIIATFYPPLSASVKAPNACQTAIITASKVCT